MRPTVAFEHRFRPDVRARGDAYARKRRVHILSATPERIEAEVFGAETYNVTASFEPKQNGISADFSCTCRYFTDFGDPCKHIWATLVSAEDQSGEFDDPAADTRAWAGDELGPVDLDEYRAAGPHPVSWRWARESPARALQPVTETPSPTDHFLTAVEMRLTGSEAAAEFPYPDSTLLYVVDGPASIRAGTTVLSVMHQKRLKHGGLSKPKTIRISVQDVALAPDHDRRLLALLSGATRRDHTGYYSQYTAALRSDATFSLTDALTLELLPVIARTARAWVRLKSDSAAIEPLAWDDGPPWRFELRVSESHSGFLVDGVLRRDDVTVPISEPFVVLGRDLIAIRGKLARFEGQGRAFLPGLAAAGGPVEVARSRAAKLAQTIARTGAAPPDLPPDLRVTTVDTDPTPRLHIDRPFESRPFLTGRVAFDYGGSVVPVTDVRATTFDAEARRVIRRRPQQEVGAMQRLADLGYPMSTRFGQTGAVEIPAGALPRVARTLVAEGWIVEAGGERYRSSTGVRLSVSSGIDWFDLTGTVEFGETTIDLPRVLAALKSGDHSVRLDDGSFGVLPENWLRRYVTLTSAGEVEGDRIRFRRSQAALLDALLAEREAEAAVTVDSGFERIRDALARFTHIEPTDPPASFAGVLRPYQREGLGWFAFLREFGFGGCLADDMGLGKTIMVLALLESRRTAVPDADEPRRPSLIVVPRSLIGNWMAEAAKFTPALRVLDQSHGARKWAPDVLADQDVVLVTYGTLWRDIAEIANVAFDYVVLDEAQAIKNAGTSSAKAARLLRARHRLALSGTPIENHLGELWSLFEFLNPGVLGRSAAFQRAMKTTIAGSAGEATLLSRALRPFILRRTKAQVARELPARTEQTITCELSEKERALYDGLRQHYREALLERVATVGLSRSKMQVLEALLRLRQAACHPALIDPKRLSIGSSKFDVLLPRLTEVLEEGHKAIVFSQFTTLLGLLREELDAARIKYEYLDGKTRDRAAHVQRFQEDPAIGLFLISLKAGGVGLNLTAAEYVFLLDPWWNPAVEAQAIDRTHRIGQTREVFAYRLIASDTVEEKVLELQQSKRALADAVLSADAAGLRHLEREDLELLLS